MTHDQCALLDLLDTLRAADGGSVMRRLLEHGLQALIEAEASGVIGAAPHERPGPGRPSATATGPGP
jgi:putative transposase